MQSFLAANALPKSESYARYWPFQELAKRLLGDIPSVSSLVHMSPLTLHFYFGALRPSFLIPSCDMHLTTLSPSDRRTLLLTSSIAHRCAYCTGHVGGMGDLLRGPLRAQAARTDLPSPPPPSREALLGQVAAAVSAVPAREPPRKEFVAALGAAAWDEATRMLAFMGWLNFVMAAADMRLEPELRPFARAVLAPLRLPFEVAGAPAESDLELLRPRAGWLGRLAGQARNVWGLVSLLPAAVVASARAGRWFAGLPGKRESERWLRELFGGPPRCVGRVTDGGLLRVVVFGLRETFVAGDAAGWGRGDRARLLYVFARGVGNEALAADAEGMAGAAGGGAAAAQRELESAWAAASGAGAAGSAFDAAARFVRGGAGPAGGISEDVQREVVRLVGEPQMVVDLIGMIGFFAFLHRVCVLSNAV